MNVCECVWWRPPVCVCERRQRRRKRRETSLSLNKTFVSSAHQSWWTRRSFMLVPDAFYTHSLGSFVINVIIFLFHSPAASRSLTESAANLKPATSLCDDLSILYNRLLLDDQWEQLPLMWSADNVDWAPGLVEKKQNKFEFEIEREYVCC